MGLRLEEYYDECAKIVTKGLRGSKEESFEDEEWECSAVHLTLGIQWCSP